jgi:hypothetical protein
MTSVLSASGLNEFCIPVSTTPSPVTYVESNTSVTDIKQHSRAT